MRTIEQVKTKMLEIADKLWANSEGKESNDLKALNQELCQLPTNKFVGLKSQDFSPS